RPEGILRLWSFGVLAMVITLHLAYVSLALHPVYQTDNERPHHALWHALFNGLAIHRDWPSKYAAEFGGATGDRVPDIAAKQYLLRHPPSDPHSVYLTEDREHLRVGVADRYKKLAYLEFVVRDPRFVLETIFIHNAYWGYEALKAYISSLRRLSVGQM